MSYMNLSGQQQSFHLVHSSTEDVRSCTCSPLRVVPTISRNAKITTILKSLLLCLILTKASAHSNLPRLAATDSLSYDLRKGPASPKQLADSSPAMHQHYKLPVLQTLQDGPEPLPRPGPATEAALYQNLSCEVPTATLLPFSLYTYRKDKHLLCNQGTAPVLSTRMVQTANCERRAYPTCPLQRDTSGKRQSANFPQPRPCLISNCTTLMPVGATAKAPVHDGNLLNLSVQSIQCTPSQTHASGTKTSMHATGSGVPNQFVRAYTSLIAEQSQWPGKEPHTGKRSLQEICSQAFQDVCELLNLLLCTGLV